MVEYRIVEAIKTSMTGSAPSLVATAVPAAIETAIHERSSRKSVGALLWDALGTVMVEPHIIKTIADKPG